MKINQANISSQNINNNEKRNNALINSGIIVGSSAIGTGVGYAKYNKEYNTAVSTLNATYIKSRELENVRTQGNSASKSLIKKLDNLFENIEKFE